MIDGQPTGAIRVSFGYMSTHSDVTKLIDFIKESFVERHIPLPLIPKSCGELICINFYDPTDYKWKRSFLCGFQIWFNFGWMELRLFCSLLGEERL